MKRILLIAILGFVIILSGFLTFYSLWNTGNPEKTCASCHEINPSLETWQQSSHRDIKCIRCHGSALSNGIHSLKEKSSMIFSHMQESKTNSEIRLNEEQVLEIMKRCSACHQEESRKWRSGGHSMNYTQLLLDDKHNEMERPYWDCLRCHGMFFEENIFELIAEDSTAGSWHLIRPEKASDPAIPCLACHEIHSENRPHSLFAEFEDTGELFYQKKQEGRRNPRAGLYVRADRIFLRADKLPYAEIHDSTGMITQSTDPVLRLCIQCHAPDYTHLSGSEDNKTPTGVHEGLSCTACHEAHSNDVINSCAQCHPAISNCNLDVHTMNTSYNSAQSEHDIHHVSCLDCHKEGLPNR